MMPAMPSRLTDEQKAERWVGLDTLRGLAVAAMVLVDGPGSTPDAPRYAPLEHAQRLGCTFADLVAPTFLFCAGVAIVPALTRRVENGLPWEGLLRSIGWRVLLLVLLGVLLSALPLVSFADGGFGLEPLRSVRLWGVLPRIGVCYGIAAVLFLFTEERAQRLVLWGSLLLYWPLITLVPMSVMDLGEWG